MLSGLPVMGQAAFLDGQFFDLSPFLDDGVVLAEVDVSRRGGRFLEPKSFGSESATLDWGAARDPRARRLAPADEAQALYVTWSVRRTGLGKGRVMKAYIDDSMADGEVLVFGGLISTTEEWEAFSLEWRQYLEDERIQVFKMKKAAHKHAKRLYRMICDHAKAGICFVVPIAPLEKVAGRYGPTGNY